MKKKTKKAAKKPRPKTVTLRQWRVFCPRAGSVSWRTFKTRADAQAAGDITLCHYDWVPARVTITYEVRR